MNKKILIMSLLGVFMLVSISFVSSAEVNIDVEKKESPLFRIRNRLMFGERIKDLATRFIRERIFFLAFQSIRGRDNTMIHHEFVKGKTCGGAHACVPTY